MLVMLIKSVLPVRLRHTVRSEGIKGSDPEFAPRLLHPVPVDRLPVIYFRRLKPEIGIKLWHILTVHRIYLRVAKQV